jgi:hypothetical protein
MSIHSATMRTRLGVRLAATTLLAAGLLASRPATLRADDDVANQQLVSTMTADDLQALLRSEGYTVDRVDAQGNVVFKVEGTKVLALIQSNKTTIVFHIGWSGAAEATQKKVNDWNKTKLYSRAYLDDEGDPALELDLDLRDGVTMGHAKRVLKSIGPTMSQFKKDVLGE